MKTRKALFDSINISDDDFNLLFRDKDYIIEAVKGVGSFEPKRWLNTFGKPLTPNIVQAHIVHTSNGLTLPLKRFSVNPTKQTLEFAGLHGYNKISEERRRLFAFLFPLVQECFISRIDLAIDFKGIIPRKVQKALSRYRVLFTYKNTNYYKTDKEGKSNQRLNYKWYDKAKKEGLSYPLYRLEFVFLRQYIGTLELKDLELLYPKLIKTIKKFSGISVQIEDFKF